MIDSPPIPLTECMWCLRGDTPHQDYHPTRADLLRIGEDMTRRVRERERWAVAQMSDEHLVAYGMRMRRLLSSAADDEWPDFLVALVGEWVHESEKEWRWRRRAASLGADPVLRSGGSWPERVERVKRSVDMLTLIGFETGSIEMHGLSKFTCCCPFHNDRHPSLDGDIERGIWFCQVCKIGGDAIRYVELLKDMSFTEAIVYLEERAGILPLRRIVE